MGPSQVDLVGAGTPEKILAAVADNMLVYGHGHTEILLIMSREHGAIMREAGWSKERVRDFLFQRARRAAKDWAASSKAELPPPRAEDQMVPVCRTPEAVVLLAGGGSGGPLVGADTALGQRREFSLRDQRDRYDPYTIASNQVL